MSTLPEPIILSRLCLDAAETVRIGGAAVSCFSRRCPTRTTDNEDAAAVIPAAGGRLILAVADGVGGHAAGAEAASITVNALVESVERVTARDPDLRPFILGGFETANRRVCDMGLGAGTTLSVAEIGGPVLRPYHVGDSVILVVGQRGRLKLETVAHSPVGYGVEAGLIDEVEAMHHEHRHIVSNIVGRPDMRIEVGAALDLGPRDTVVLGSDGLFDNLHVAEIVDLVRKDPLPEVAERLAAACHARMTVPTSGVPSKSDDLTFVLYRPRAARRRGHVHDDRAAPPV